MPAGDVSVFVQGPTIVELPGIQKDSVGVPSAVAVLPASATGSQDTICSTTHSDDGTTCSTSSQPHAAAAAASPAADGHNVAHTSSTTTIASAAPQTGKQLPAQVPPPRGTKHMESPMLLPQAVPGPTTHMAVSGAHAGVMPRATAGVAPAGPENPDPAPAPASAAATPAAAAEQPLSIVQVAPGVPHVDLEADRAALAAELSLFTPEMILRELLGSLFVHPSRLRYDKLLGQGAYATVHKANMLLQEGSGEGGLRMGVAVKRLKPEVLSGSGDLKDFLLEVNVLRKLKHPNIVAIRGIGATDLSSLEAVRGSMYVVMEVLEGGTLREVVTRQMTSRTLVYEAKDALRWAQQIASAMHYLHEVCRPMIIHRDMKLENLLVDEAMRVAKLADFGLHKRARLNTATGALVPAATNAPLLDRLGATTGDAAPAMPPHGLPPVSYNYDDEKSYYGGNMFNPAGASTHNARTVHGPGIPRPPSMAQLQQLQQQQQQQPAAGGSVHSTATRGATAVTAQQLGTALSSSLFSPSNTAAAPASKGGDLVSQALAVASNGDAAGGTGRGVSLEAPGPRALQAVNLATSSGGSSSNNPSSHLKNPSRHGLLALQHAAEAGVGGSTHGGGGGMRRNASLKDLVEIAAGAAPKPAGAVSKPAGGSPRAVTELLEAVTSEGGGSTHGNSAYRQSRFRRQRSQTGADESVHGGSTALAALAAAGPQTSGDAGAAALQLPAGVATFLADPAQLHNLHSLHTLLEQQHETDASSSLHGRLSSLAGSASNTHHAATATSPAGSLHAAARALEAAAAGASMHGEGIYAPRSAKPSEDSSKAAAQPAQSAMDVSVHRKMLALMALDLTPQGPYCARPQGSFCSWPRGLNSLATNSAEAGAPGSGHSSRDPSTHAAADAAVAAAAATVAAAPGGTPGGGANMAAAAAASGPADLMSVSGKRGMKAIPEDSRMSMDLAAPVAHAATTGATATTAGAAAVDGSGHGLKAARMASGKAAAAVEKLGPVGLMTGPAGLGTASGRGGDGSRRSAMFAEATQQVGSLMYMAPELVNGQQYNHKVDVFSFGVILWELFSGKLMAFKAELLAGGEEEVMAYVQRRAAGERERLPARWPAPLKELVAACWHQDPARRPSFKDISKWLDALESTSALDGLIPSHLGITQGPGGGCCTVM